MKDQPSISDALDVEAKRIAELVGLDAIQIVGTYMDDEGQTVRVSGGSGNWYTRLGVMREILFRDEEHNREHVRRTGDFQ